MFCSTCLTKMWTIKKLWMKNFVIIRALRLRRKDLLLFCFFIKVFRFQRKTLLFSYGTFFVIMLIIIFFHKICPGDFSETIRPISKIFSGMIGIYLKFIPYWDFWKIHFRFRVRVHFLTFYDPFCARKFSKTNKDIELKFSG